MKYISMIIFLFSTLSSCCCGFLSAPEYKLIKKFSSRLKEEGIILSSYGVNTMIITPPNHIKNHISDFSVGYMIYKSQSDIISLASARCLIVSLAESFLNEINSDMKIRNSLDKYPFPMDRVDIFIHFMDKNGVGLGNGGVESIFLYEGRIKYKKYEILEYTPPVPFGKNYPLHEESYEEALDIVQNQGCLRQL